MSLPRLNGWRYSNPSLYNQQITLMMPSEAPLTDGSPGSPVVYAQNVWAAVKLMRQNEIDKTEQVQGASYYDVRIAYDSNVQDDFTIISPTGATWFIETVADVDGRQIEMKITARVIDDGGVTTEITEFVQGSQF